MFLDMIDRMERAARDGRLSAIVLPDTAAPDIDLEWHPEPDPATGALTQDPDFTLATTAGPLAWRLFHDSQNAATDSEWGFGRSASWPLRLNSDGTTITVTHDDGTARQYRAYAGVTAT